MNQEEKQEKFLDLCYFERLNEWKKIAKYDPDNNANKYKSIDAYIAEKCECEVSDIINYREVLKEKIDEIERIKTRCTEEREKGFGSFKNFYEWYLKQPQECHYCKTSQNDLTLLFNNYFKPKKDPWKNGTLQIEKLKPDEGYNPDNCVLACVLCNNAKSDLISDDDFKSKFAEPMREYLQEKIINLKK